MRIAVLTDAVSTEFYFPLWHKYYAAQVGAKNIYVLFPKDAKYDSEFFPLGGLYEFTKFDNLTRVIRTGEIVADLLSHYDYVIHVDTDEFLIANPYKFSSLRAYLNSLRAPIVTARGYNLIQGSDEPRLDLTRQLLHTQRNFMYPYSAVNKTCVVSVNTKWSPGFHFCNHQPLFDDLLLVHAKLADVDIQIAIGREVAVRSDDAKFVEYHTTPVEVLEQRMARMRNYAVLTARNDLYRKDYNDEFLSKIRFVNAFGGIYHGEVLPPEQVLITLDSHFMGVM